MEGLREYIISVVAAALVSGILSRLLNNGFPSEIIRLLCNFFLTITVISPLVNWEFGDLMDISAPYFQNAQEISDAGKQYAENAMAELIITQSEAYILDKAATWGAELSVDILLNEQQIPEYATLGGEISPYIRRQLEDVLETHLGITKENQIWTG